MPVNLRQVTRVDEVLMPVNLRQVTRVMMRY